MHDWKRSDKLSLCFAFRGESSDTAAESMAHGFIFTFEITSRSRVEVAGPTEIHPMARVEILPGLLEPFAHLFYIILSIICGAVAMAIMSKLNFVWSLIQSDLKGRGELAFDEFVFVGSGGVCFASWVDLTCSDIDLFKLSSEVEE